MSYLWNPADKSSDVALSDGDSVAYHNISGQRVAKALTFVSAGKVYTEMQLQASPNTNLWVGFMNAALEYTSSASNVGAAGVGVSVQANSVVRSNGATQFLGGSLLNNNVVGFALDFEAGRSYFSINGAWRFGGDPSAGTGGAVFSPANPVCAACNPRIAGVKIFGEGQFNYAVPTGYTAYGAGGPPPPEPGFKILSSGVWVDANTKTLVSGVWTDNTVTIL